MRAKIGLVIGLAGLFGLVAGLAPRNAVEGREKVARVANSARPRPSPLVGSDATNRAREPFVVHEWGTFTNFAGADGVQLEFRPLVDSDLPYFVSDREWQYIGPFSKRRIFASQRMETPVTYFYTDRPREIEVRVGFPQGLLTEFYPPVRQMGPEFSYGESLSLTDSFLDWGKIRILPEAEFRKLTWTDGDGAEHPFELPAVEGENHYGHARETDSAVVEMIDQYEQRHYEKFLFYRGVGNFKLPLALTAQGDGRFTVTNSGAEAVESLFLVRIEEGRVRFSYHPEVAAGGSLSMSESSVDGTVDDLGEAMVAALIEQGLYEKEARSMVKTWQSSWFGEEGTRLLYTVPQRLTEEVLPISISPQPDELIRVLVGRMEVMTPEHADRLARTVRDLGTCVTATTEPLAGELAVLGRFAEPAIESMMRDGRQPGQELQFRSLIAELRHGP